MIEEALLVRLERALRRRLGVPVVGGRALAGDVGTEAASCACAGVHPAVQSRPGAPSTLFVLQLLGTIRCPEKPRAAHLLEALGELVQSAIRGDPEAALLWVSKDARVKAWQHSGATTVRDLHRAHVWCLFPPENKFVASADEITRTFLGRKGCTRSSGAAPRPCVRSATVRT